MKTWFTYLITFLLINTLSLVTFADKQSKYSDDLNIANFEKGRRISPFELASISFSMMKYDYKPVEIATGNKVFTKNGTVTNYTIHFEKPVYEEYVSYGLNFGFNLGVNPYTTSSFDTTLSLKLRYPIYMEGIGDFAVNVTGGAGVSTFCFGKSGTARGGAWGALTNDDKDFNSKNIELRLGSVQTLSYGVDYYPVIWLGVFLEAQSRFYNYGETQFESKKRDFDDNFYKKSFKYSISNKLTLGIRTTF